MVALQNIDSKTNMSRPQK